MRDSGRVDRRRRLRCAAQIALALALTLAGAKTAPASTPLSGEGMWIWQVSESGGTADRIARAAKRRKLDLVLVKSGDGTGIWSQFSPDLVSRLHRAGLKVCAWHFVHGHRPGAEARASASAKERGADCLVIDAEASYEGRYEEADRYMRRLRALVGGRYPLALTSFPYVDFHPAFPYSVFLAPGGADFNMPQLYWRAIGDPMRQAYSHTYRWNRLYQRAIFPIGQTWMGPPAKQIRRFRRLGAALGARGVSWWSWQETGGRQWRAVGGRLRGRVTRPRVGRPQLSRGDSGDPVLLVQQLLRAHEMPAALSGRFRGRTARAVGRFQTARGLTPTGVVDRPTWHALLEREPIRVAWARRGSPAFVARGTAPRRYEARWPRR